MGLTRSQLCLTIPLFPFNLLISSSLYEIEFSNILLKLKRKRLYILKYEYMKNLLFALPYK